MKILIIDDDPNIRFVLSRIVGRDHEPLEAATYSDGVKLARAEQPNVILADLRLPDSHESQSPNRMIELRQASPNSQIIAISGIATEEIARQVIASGADVFVEKDEKMASVIMDRIEQSKKTLGSEKVLAIIRKQAKSESSKNNPAI